MVRKNTLFLYIVNLILFCISIVALTPISVGTNLGDIMLFTPIVAIASFIYIKIKKTGNSALRKFIQVSNVIFFLFPVSVLSYLLLCFLYDWDVKFLWGL